MRFCSATSLLALMAGGILISGAHSAQAQLAYFNPNDLVISESTYPGYSGTAALPANSEAAALTVGSPIIVAGSAAAGATGNAVADGSNLSVFQNSAVDGSFGIATPLTLVQINPTTGAAEGSLTLPTSQIVTSFPSKSEGSLALTQNGQGLTVAGYNVADGRNPVGALDVSNASTTTTSAAAAAAAGNANGYVNRTVAQIGTTGQVQTTNFTAYSGNNPRAAIQYNGDYYTVGNGNTGLTGVVQINPNNSATQSTTTDNATQIGTYNVTQNGYPADKSFKDNNYRGETIYNDTLYVTKGSGSNGINTVYQVGATGALANGANLSADASISILPGFPDTLARSSTPKHTPANAPDFTPFGLFFANSTTLYVSDEGTGDAIDLASHAGLEKWSLLNGIWGLDYTLQSGLIGDTQTYDDPNFTGTVTDIGLRDITGNVNGNTVTICGVTATTDNISGNDNGDDPNQLACIADNLDLTSLPTTESFYTLVQAPLGTVIRGVSDAPVPEPASLALFGTAIVGMGAMRRRRRQVAL